MTMIVKSLGFMEREEGVGALSLRFLGFSSGDLDCKRVIQPSLYKKRLKPNKLS